MAARRYSYPKFLDHQSIRLVRIVDHPASGGVCAIDHDAKQTKTFEHLYLEVVQFPMGCEPRYRALSYTWGPPRNGQRTYAKSDKITIVLDGEEHDVTPNLFDAILQMSASYQDSYFWIDALCINQGDLTERQVHVAIMDRIYRNAEEVVVWIGKAEDDNTEVMRLIQKVAQMNDSFFHSLGHAESPGKLSTYGLPHSSDPIWSQYLDFYERKWFNRGWVIQEVVLGQQVVAHWGALTLSWNDLVVGSKIFLPERLRKTLFASFRSGQDMDSLPLGRNVWRIGLIQDACIQGDTGSLLIVEICTGTHGLVSGEHVLLHLMRMARDFEWGDPRDRVYSLLGLVNYTAQLQQLPPLALTPDYSEAATEATVLTAAATAIISRSNYLGLIAQVSDPSFRKVQGLASWVPDFTRSPNFSNGRRNLFNADKYEASQAPFFRFQGSSLSVRGVRMGFIRKTQDLKHDNRIEVISGMLRIASESTLPLGLDRIDVLWRTMIWDIYGHAHVADLHPAPDYLANSFLTWIYAIIEQQGNQLSPIDLSRCRQLLGLDSKEGNLEALSVQKAATQSRSKYEVADPGTFTSHASGVIWSQQLCLMDTGYLGMGPKSGMMGDEVWIISGCPFPMVLRKVLDTEMSYFVLGRAYVHGVMHGEVVDDSTTWEEINLE